MENNRCPICGCSLKDPLELQDGTVCRKCEEDLRFLHPLIYLPRVGMLEEHPQCGELSRKDLTYLKKHRREKECRLSGGKKMTSYRFDPLQLLTMEDFRRELISADAMENQIRTWYQDYTNVFTVDYGRPLYSYIGKKGVQNIRRRRYGSCAAGWIRAGSFREGDMVGILHEGMLRYANILALQYEEDTVSPDGKELRTNGAEELVNAGEQGRRIRAGYQVTMVLDEKASGITAGDWIVSD